MLSRETTGMCLSTISRLERPISTTRCKYGMSEQSFRSLPIFNVFQGSYLFVPFNRTPCSYRVVVYVKVLHVDESAKHIGGCFLYADTLAPALRAWLFFPRFYQVDICIAFPPAHHSQHHSLHIYGYALPRQFNHQKPCTKLNFSELLHSHRLAVLYFNASLTLSFDMTPC